MKPLLLILVPTILVLLGCVEKQIDETLPSKDLQQMPTTIPKPVVPDPGPRLIRPFSETCAHTELVILATIAKAREIPKEAKSPSERPWSRYGFSRVAEVEVEEVLLGDSPLEGVRLYGGKVGAGTFYRLEEGRFLLMLREVEQGAYRAVEYQYSFMPFQDGLVKWSVRNNAGQLERITPEEAAKRIHRHQWNRTRPTSRGNSLATGAITGLRSIGRRNNCGLWASFRSRRMP